MLRCSVNGPYRSAMAELFLQILTGVSLPIVMITVIGYIAQRALHFDVATLNRVLLYALTPCLMFQVAATMETSAAAVAFNLGLTAIIWLTMLGLGWGLAALFGAPKDIQPLIGLCLAMPNSGNYGLPLVELAYGTQYLGDQVLMMSGHAIMLMTVGVAVLSGGQGVSGRTIALKIAKLPYIPALAGGFLFNWLNSETGIELPAFVEIPLVKLGQTMPQLALFALGAMLVSTSMRGSWGPIIGVTIARFLIVPALTLLMVVVSGLPDAGRLDDQFFLTAALPTAVLIPIMAAEHKRNPDLATSIVFVTTVLSPIAVTAALLITGLGPA